MPSNLLLLQGGDATALADVLAETRDRVTRARASGDSVTLLVYYSGHADAAGLRMEGSDFPLRKLRESVEGAGADLTLLVLDACQVGELLRAKGGTPIAAFPMDTGGGVVEGMAVITAAAAGEDAQESERLGGGVFTHHLLAGLAGAADTSADRRVTLLEAWQYAHARTLVTTSRAPVVQHPSYAFDLTGEAELTLTVLDGARRTGRLRVADAGSYVVLDAAESRIVAEAELAAGGGLALPPGSYRVRRRLPDRVYDATVSVLDGQDTALATADMRSQPFGQTARRGSTSSTYAAVGVTAGGGVLGPLQDGLGAGPAARIGVRADLPWLSLMVQGTWSHAAVTNDFLTIDQHFGGGELAALRFADLGRVSLGVGVEGGVGAVVQTFETTGDAPTRTAVVGWVGPTARAELALAPRLTLGVDAAWDIHVLPVAVEDGTGLDARPTPRAAADLTVWVR